MKMLAVPCLLAAALAAQSPGERDFDQLDGLVTLDSIRAHLRFLSHDLLEGRGPGTRGDELSQLYLATQLESFGLRPGGPDGSWTQDVPIVGITSAITKPMTVRGPDGEELVFQGPAEFTAQAARPEPSAVWQDLPLVFVGYGIRAPEQDWDDYGDVDVRGKVVLVMNDDPSADPGLFAGRRRLYYGRWSYKYEEAARRGAAGAIVIHTTPSAGYPFQVIQAGHERERFFLPFTEDAPPSLPIQAWCAEDAARRIAALGGQDLDALRERAEQRGFRPVELGVRIDLATRNAVREIRTANVAGLLPGVDPTLEREAVVVTAHYDHLGRGPARGDDDIYNGAVDNASGTAAVLTLARAAARAGGGRRSMIFLFVGAEEQGLLGSQFYARHPTWPRQQIAANVNVDGLNVFGATRDLEMIGHGKSSLTAVADAVAARRGRVVVANKQPELGLFYRSDHFSFARIGVPSVYFKAGSDFLDAERAANKRRAKASYTTVMYHQPNDEFNPLADLSGAVADARLLLELLYRVADADRMPTWAPGDEFEKHR
jgi:Zn-dependent M28 family amino/carboxypeptidase